MSKYTKKRGDLLDFSFWLSFDVGGDVALTRTEPTVSRDQRAMQVTTTLPKSLFVTPTISATLNVLADTVKSHEIDVETLTSAMRDVVGVDIDFTITSQEQPE